LVGQTFFNFSRHGDKSAPPAHLAIAACDDRINHAVTRVASSCGSKYQGPLSVEWEDSRMDREHGAAEAAAFVKRIDFKPSAIAFDAQFDR